MGYWDLSSDPWSAWKDMYDTLAGGKTAMGRAPLTNAAQLPTIATFSLDVPGKGFNPSVAMFNGRLMAIVRTVPRQSTINMLGEIRDRKLIGARRVGDPRGVRTKWGFEDCRLFTFEGVLHVSATFGDAGASIGQPRARMAVLRIGPSGDFETVVSVSSIRHEKNWMPVVDQIDDAERLRFVYSTAPFVLLHWAGGPSPSPDTLQDPNGLLRGGSQLVPWKKDEWIAVVHECAVGKDKLYTHRFVTFDKELTKATKVGRPFYFQKRGIEFCSGLIAPTGSDGFYRLSYGVDDTRAFVGEVVEETIEEFLEGGDVPVAAVAPPPVAPVAPRATPVKSVPPPPSRGSGGGVYGGSGGFP